jgi:hypothetical protein
MLAASGIGGAASASVAASAGAAKDGVTSFKKPKAVAWWATVTDAQKDSMRAVVGDADVDTDDKLKAWVLQCIDYNTLNTAKALEEAKDPSNWPAGV